jgi:hypothetical protein
LIFKVERLIGVPTEPMAVSSMGLSRENRSEFEQVRAPKAFNRFCVIVLAMEATLSPPARIRFLIVLQSELGSAALSNATRPVTWGVAIDVPLSVE